MLGLFHLHGCKKAFPCYGLLDTFALLLPHGWRFLHKRIHFYVLDPRNVKLLLLISTYRQMVPDTLISLLRQPKTLVPYIFHNGMLASIISFFIISFLNTDLFLNYFTLPCFLTFVNRLTLHNLHSTSTIYIWNLECSIQT